MSEVNYPEVRENIDFEMDTSSNKDAEKGKNELGGSDQADEPNSLDESIAEDDIQDVNIDAERDGSDISALIADIFGESEDEGEFKCSDGEDVENIKTEPVKTASEKRKRARVLSDSEDEEEKENNNEEVGFEYGIVDYADLSDKDEEFAVTEKREKKKKKVDSDKSGGRKKRKNFVSDFDLMMAKKKEENPRIRRRKDVDIINDNDDLIARLIALMRSAAEEDKNLNKQKEIPTKKLKMVSMVISQMKKHQLKMAFLDQGILNVIAEWLAPLPDRSLPHTEIREEMLKVLLDWPSIDKSYLKSSAIGKAVMYLFKHPEETKENKLRAGRLITEWLRPIFNISTDYRSMTKDEREQMDSGHISRRRELRDQNAAKVSPKVVKEIDPDFFGQKNVASLGDKHWNVRARIPEPSRKTYVTRPQWNVETEFSSIPSKKPLNRMQKHMKKVQEKKRLSKLQRATTVSIDGRNLI